VQFLPVYLGLSICFPVPVCLPGLEHLFSCSCLFTWVGASVFLFPSVLLGWKICSDVYFCLHKLRNLLVCHSSLLSWLEDLLNLLDTCGVGSATPVFCSMLARGWYTSPPTLKVY